MTTNNFFSLKAGDVITLNTAGEAMDMTAGKAYLITDINGIGSNRRVIFTDDVGDRRGFGSNWARLITQVNNVEPAVEVTQVAMLNLLDSASEVIIDGKKYVKKSVWVAAS